MFNFIQTFFIDKAAVQNAPSVLITGIDLFVKAKPSTTLNSSGIAAPGISVSICPVENGVPNVDKEIVNFSRTEYNSIFAIEDASVATPFGFDRPILVSTDAYYGAIIRMDDSNFQLWTNRAGDAILGTNDPSPGSTSSRDGALFQGSNDGSITPVNDTDLKFRVKIAKFAETSNNLEFVNKDYEFLTVNTRSAEFVGGENVFANTAAITGTANFSAGNTAVVGTSTDFTQFARGQSVVLKSNNNYFVGKIDLVEDATHLYLEVAPSISNTAGQVMPGVVGTLHTSDYTVEKITLNNSTANSTFKFAAGQQIQGERSGTTALITSVDNINVDEFTSHIAPITHSPTSAFPAYSLAINNAGSYSMDATYAPLTGSKQTPSLSGRHVLVSRSNEVALPTLYGTTDKSAHVKVAVTTSNPYIAPIIDNFEADITVNEFIISAVGSQVVSSVDTEIGANGNQKAKHITKKITFEKDREPEALRVFASIYRPQGTDVLLYAKLQSATDYEPFDDKPWTPLVIKNAASGLYSSSVDKQDFLEFEFGLPAYPEVLSTVPTTFTGAEGNATLTGATTSLGSDLANGKLVRVYDPFFPTNQFVARVLSFTSSNITLEQAVPTGFGLGNAGLKVDVLKYNTAFENSANDNIVRYFTSGGAVHDRFIIGQIKVVLQANSTNLVPTVDQLEVIGVSS